MTLAARVARLLRVNLSARFGRARDDNVNCEKREPTRTTSAPYGEADYSKTKYGGDKYSEAKAEGASQPRSQPTVNSTLAGYYANLELPYGADRAAVRAARRRLLARYHPDRFPGNSDRTRLANDLVKQLNHAHDELIKHLEEQAHA